MNVIITGASGGIGRALAIEYSKNQARLFLFGRSKSELGITANLCVQHGGVVEVFEVDVTDFDGMKAALDEICGRVKVDVVYANAGVSAGTSGGCESIFQIQKIIDVNINGVVNTIEPVVSYMREWNSGHVVLISSMAGFVPLPSSPTYSATKAFVRYYGNAIGILLKPFQISVTVVCPGYIRTKMTDVNKFPMPFLMSPEKAARIIINGVNKKKSIVAFPRRMYFAIQALRFSGLSRFILGFLLSKFPSKPAFQAD